MFFWVFLSYILADSRTSEDYIVIIITVTAMDNDLYREVSWNWLILWNFLEIFIRSGIFD